MTTYVLVGGAERQHPSFAKEMRDIVIPLADKPRLLSCLFAKKPMVIEEATDEWMTWFEDTFGDTVEIELAREQDFLEQIERADVVYLHGGDNATIIAKMKQYDHLIETFDGKTVVASSAGANFLSDNFYTRKFREWQKGTGTLKIDLMVHYGAETDNDGQAVDWDIALKSRDPESTNPLIQLPEGGTTVLRR